MGPPEPCNPPDEGIADEAPHDGHRVLGEAELNIPLVPETFQPPRRTVVPQRPHGARQIAFDDASGQPVQFSTAKPQPVEDGSRRSLVLGGAATLPAAPDHHHLGAVVGLAGQRLSKDAGVTKAPVRMFLAPQAASTTRVPFALKRATVEAGGTSEPRISVGELPKSNPATFALPDAEVRLGRGASSTEATGTTLAPFERIRLWSCSS